MQGVGTIVNGAAILAGGLIGLLIKKGVPITLAKKISHAMGVAVIMIGISGVLQGIFRVSGDPSLARVDLMVLLLSLVIGTVLGYLLHIEQGFDHLGDHLAKRFSGGSSKFSEGFVSSTVMYCVGAMAILGAMEDGLGRPETLFVKAVLDGVTSIILASSLGVGVCFSALPVVLYQGLITLLAAFVRPYASPALLGQMSMAGSAVIFCIGLNMMELPNEKISIASMLPATFLPIVFDIIYRVTGLRLF